MHFRFFPALICLMALFFLGSTTLMAQGKKKSEGHRIQFKVKGYHDTTAVIAHYYGDNQYIPKDTARFDSKGNLSFDGKNELPEGVYLLVLPRNRYVEFVIGEQFQSLEFDTIDAISSMKIKEGQENQVFYNYQKTMSQKAKDAAPVKAAISASKNPDTTAKWKARLEAIDKEVKDFREKLFADHPNSFSVKLFKAAMEPEVPAAKLLPNGRKDSLFQFLYYRDHFFDNIDLSDDRMVRTPLFHNKVEQYIQKLTLQIPDSINFYTDRLLGMAKSKEAFKYIVWWVTNTYEKSQIMGMDAVFVHMAKNYYLSGKAYWVDSAVVNKIRERAKILEPILIGKKAPNMWLTDTTGKLFTLDGFKAKSTVLYFWDPNCGHCQKETPKLYEFWEKNKARGIDVFAVTIDRKPDDWKKYIREKKLNWLNVWDSYTATDFKNMYDIYSTPVIYILDENKKILAKRIGVEQLPDFFFNYLKDNIKFEFGKSGESKVEKSDLKISPSSELVEGKKRNLKSEIIRLKPRKSGTFQIEAVINDLPLNGIFDTGASDLSISLAEAMVMIKQGTLQAEDIGEKQTFSTADGNISEGTKINIKTLKIGSIVLKNIEASIVNNLEAPILIGQSVLKRFNSFKVDNKKNLLIIEY